MDAKTMEIACGLRVKSFDTLIHSAEYLDEEEGEEEEETIEEEFSENNETIENEDTKLSITSNTAENAEKLEVNKTEANVLKSQKGQARTISANFAKTQNHTNSANELQTKIENHFIDVGSLTYGGIFGVGEKLEHRVIMARNTVQCLCLPLYWLLEDEQNPGNFWQRRRFYLDSNIPSREILFNDFILTRKWQKFKDNLIQSNMVDFRGNPTKVQDIPIYMRLVDASDE